MAIWINRGEPAASTALRQLGITAEDLREDWLHRALFLKPDLLLAGQVDPAFAEALRHLAAPSRLLHL